MRGIVENFNFTENIQNLENEKLRIIENASFDVTKKLDLALLALGKKSAAQIGHYKVFEGETEQVRTEVAKQFSEEFANIKQLLDSLHLEYYVKDAPEEKDGIFGFSLLVANKKDLLLQAILADRNDDDKAFGLLMGYPSTAVEAYRTKNSFDYETDLSKEELEQIKKENLLPFLHFMPSKDHWNDELEFARKNKQLIQEKCPKLYTDLTETEYR